MESKKSNPLPESPNSAKRTIDLTGTAGQGEKALLPTKKMENDEKQHGAPVSPLTLFFSYIRCCLVL